MIIFHVVGAVRPAGARMTLVKTVLAALALCSLASSLPGPLPTASATQAVPTLTLSPNAGPCDGAVEVQLAGFEPNSVVRLDIAKPQTDTDLAGLDPATIDGKGAYVGTRHLGDAGCAAATLAAGRGFITIYAGSDPDRMSVAARAEYRYTSTTAGAATPAGGASSRSKGSDRTRWLAAAAAAGLAVVVIGSIFLRGRLRRSRERRT
jgi:hypothetical protein